MSTDPPVAQADLTGSRFGTYEILEVLGSGGMGKVYRARDMTLERVVALKTLAPHLSSDGAFVQRFLKEARAAARLNHPNIVQIYNFGQVDGIYYLAMEFVDGHSLGTYLKKGHFSEADAILIARHACQGLGVAHAHGIVHRDIKPDNLMLTGRGDVKLVDLGIAKRLDEDQGMTTTGVAIGTPHYISPEQIRGQKDIDHRADIYSLGATLYHLVTGHTPYKGTSGPVVMSMHLVEPLPDPRQFEPGVSEGLCRILRKMMAKDRRERYRDIHGVDVDLYALQCGETPEPEEPTASVVATASLSVRQPASGPAPETTLDPAALTRIEESLATAIGPMAKVIVRQTARATPRLEDLCASLAAQIEPGPARDAFLARCLAARRAASTPPPPTRTPPPASTPPTRVRSPQPATAWDEAKLQVLETELARQIGPLARVLVKRAAKSTPTTAALLQELAENIPSEEGRKAFREAVRNLRLGA